MKRFEMGVEALDVRGVLHVVERRPFERLVPSLQCNALGDQTLMLKVDRVARVASHASSYHRQRPTEVSQP